MSATTGTPNKLDLTPVSGTVRPRFFAGLVRTQVENGHSRSLPVGRESTFKPRFVKPVAPTERPVDTASTALPLEPARVPVPGAIPG
jgi:hypothetical protein